MKILITSDFYTDFALYDTSDPADLELRAMRATLYDVWEDDPRHVLLFTSNENILTEDAIDAADRIIYTSDFLK